MADKDTELEDLLALIESPGWQRFLEYTNQEWSSKAYRRKAQAILKKLSQEGKIEHSATHLLQLETAAEAVEGLFAWVQMRIEQLRRLRQHTQEAAR